MPPMQEEDCDAYNTFRDECFKRIETHAADGEEFCFYVIPPFHFGLPVYDPDHVFMKLYAELSQLNYQLLAWPAARRIFIAWYEEEETAAEHIRSAVSMYQHQHQQNMSSRNPPVSSFIDGGPYGGGGGEEEDEESSDHDDLDPREMDEVVEVLLSASPVSVQELGDSAELTKK